MSEANEPHSGRKSPSRHKGYVCRFGRAGYGAVLGGVRRDGQARDDFDRYPTLWSMMERVLCPRVHFKCIIADGAKAYFGSANLTGAGIGAKSERKRNFENGILTDDPVLVEPLAEQFDSVWRGEFCRNCGRREHCADPVV